VEHVFARQFLPALHLRETDDTDHIAVAVYNFLPRHRLELSVEHLDDSRVIIKVHDAVPQIVKRHK